MDVALNPVRASLVNLRRHRFLTDGLMLGSQEEVMRWKKAWHLLSSSKAAHSLRILSEALAQDLQGDMAFQLGIRSAPNVSHSTSQYCPNTSA